MNITSISTAENGHTHEKHTTKPSTQLTGEFQLRHADKHKRSKTVLLLFDFYKASEKAIASYCSLYHGYGFDVLYVKSHFKHFVWPKNSQTLASKLLQHIQTDDFTYENILVHAASMGAYNFGVIMAEMYEKPELHEKVRKKIKAVVYDSLTIGSLDNMAKGVSQGTQNVVLQKILPILMHAYFYITWSQTVALYEHYIAVFKQRPLEVPTLMFTCRNDPMSDYHAVEDLVELWQSHYKFPLTHRCWEKSRHAAHLRIHREEYVRDLDTFLSSVPDLDVNIKLKAKM
ncbi:hypothetical protein DPMN_072080 [Dreissena polymorpha]|uniref:Uncharacterized protein n=2 Tax=Dreissena polymorpha TaxID=45954 RepID=A0A9D3Z3U6_DREPO|nr:hypothetical protein DPMN_072080 [Dreissena polymorpha]